MIDRRNKGTCVLLSIRKTIADLAHKRHRWDALMRAAGRTRAATVDAVPSRLREVSQFGSNPGNLRMFTYVPPRLAADPALVVVLHGCTQTAAGYDHGAGWSTLADRYGFALLLPEQKRANNLNCCFNWFLPADTQRDQGEAASIRQMIETAVDEHGIDRRRVFVTGLSAGGAMTSVMLACYPDVFAGGAIIAGLPYGAAANVQQAFESMFQSPPRAARAWGDLVRAASSHRGPWPRVAVWHGDADTTVVPTNAHEILKQWIDVHGLPADPSVRATQNGHARAIWFNAAGDEVIESFTVSRMAHGTPLATGTAVDACGNAGPFLLEAGISSSWHIAKFFGLTETRVDHAALPDGSTTSIIPELRPFSPLATTFVPPSELPHREGAPHADRHDEPPPAPAGPIDIGAVITNALRAAGLMKGR
jgi:poly(hydroxyalkanoate) depolymerase family esterase